MHPLMVSGQITCTAGWEKQCSDSLYTLECIYCVLQFEPREEKRSFYTAQARLLVSKLHAIGVTLSCNSWE